MPTNILKQIFTKIIGMTGKITTHESDKGETVINIDPTYAGQPSIHTLGTVLIGKWKAATIDPSVGGTGVDNGEHTIRLGGDLRTTNSLLIKCSKNTEVTLPKDGTLVNRKEALDPEKNLSDISMRDHAYDNIAPTSRRGEIAYHDGETHMPLACGIKGTILTSDGEKPIWQRNASYKYIVSTNIKSATSFHYPARDTLNIIPKKGFIIADDEQRNETTLDLSERLSDLNRDLAPGFLVVDQNQKDGVYKTVVFKEGTGIKVRVSSDDPEFSISPQYQGQASIDTLGTILTGEWQAKPISPAFGGTGNANQYSISLGGELTTSCNVTFNNFAGMTQYITIRALGNTEVVLPTFGNLATTQESLQCKHNLGDVKSPTEAFRNISPTKRRGDLIVRGYGDYDTVLEAGKSGQALIVNPEERCGLGWKNILDEEQVDEMIKKALKEYSESIKVEAKAKVKAAATLSIETMLEAILMQLDSMKNKGQITPIKELKTVMDLWIKQKKKN